MSDRWQLRLARVALAVGLDGTQHRAVENLFGELLAEHDDELAQLRASVTEIERTVREYMGGAPPENPPAP